MQVMPAAMVNLLKKRSISGTSKPAYRLTIEDSPIGGLTDPSVWTTWRYFAGQSDNKGLGNIEETADGRAVISYVENNAVYIAFAPSVAGVLNGTETFDFTNAILIKTGNEYGCMQSSITKIKGILHLAITSYIYTTEYIMQCEHWKDTDGNGTGFAFYNYISTDLTSGTSWARELPKVGNDLGQIICLSDTNWVIICPSYTYIYQGNRCCYTQDAGETWHNGSFTPTSLFYYLAGSGISVLPLTETSFMIGWQSSSDYHKFLHYTNCGATMASEDVAWAGSNCGWITVKDQVYMALSNGGNYDIYSFNLDTPTYETAKDINNYNKIASIGYLESGKAMFTLTESALVLQHKDTSSITGAGTMIARRPLQVKKIEVDRQKGAASVLTVVMDNKGGQYSPDNINSPWYGVIWPNKRVVLQWGYGTDLAYGFTGLVDRVKMSTFPAELTITCRDMLKLALDQTVTDELGGHTIYYTNETIEDIFLYLANASGYASEDIVYEPTGITLEGFLVSEETYADAFTRLCELCGFEYYCDAQGKLYFVRANDRSPQQEDEITLSGTNPVELSKYPIVTDSIQVWSAPG